jgi:hypothetical protein
MTMNLDPVTHWKNEQALVPFVGLMATVIACSGTLGNLHAIVGTPLGNKTVPVLQTSPMLLVGATVQLWPGQLKTTEDGRIVHVLFAHPVMA